MHRVVPRLEDFTRQRGYGDFTVSQSHAREVSHYIARQKQHHQKTSFRDEFIQFLVVNEIEFDERYV